jgi:uracil phosphoribosyltransferase
MFLLIVLIVAFVVGIRNLTWYFSKDKLLVAEIDPDLTEQVYD